MSYGYGGRANPYDQRGQPSPQYGQPHYNAPTMGRDDYATQNVEMEPLTKNGANDYSQQDPNAILNACREIDQGILEIKDTLQMLQGAQAAFLNDASGNKAAFEQLENMNASTMALYRNLVGKLKNIKQKPDSGSPRNAPQVGKVDRKLRETMEMYQTADAQFRRKLQEQAARQYRIVRPDATEEEVRQAVDEPNQQMFAQALMQSNRQGQAQSTLNAVTQRHEAINNITRQLIELSELFQDMDNLVMQQEAAVVNIEQKGEEVVENMDKGTEQIGVAIKSARNARKWKWWCLGIVVLIIVIIVVIVLIYKFVIQNNNTTTVKTGTAKRFVLTDMMTEKLSTAGHRVVSGSSWAPISEKWVNPGVDYTPDSETVGRAVVKKMRSFQA